MFIPSIFLGIAAFLIIFPFPYDRYATPADRSVKAFGYSRWSIGWHYLKFALVIIAGGSLLGVAWGSGSAPTWGNVSPIFSFSRLRFRLTPSLIGWSLLISGGSAFLGALAAVGKRRPCPRPRPCGRNPRPGFSRLAGTSGPAGSVHPPIPMILRHLTRKKMKALLRVFGIAWAVAILVVGFYGFDAMDYIMKVQFGEIQREDATVLFHNPRPARVATM